MTAHAVPPELLDSVVRRLRPHRVFLFGSAARGEAEPPLSGNCRIPSPASSRKALGIPETDADEAP
jgi:hypothetical protein